MQKAYESKDSILQSMKLLILLFTYASATEIDYCSLEDTKCDKNVVSTRYLFYDVNPSEGFNLRRDVYMRFAILSHKLQQSTQPSLNSFKLVLPPWVSLHHWKNNRSEKIPWSEFFHLPSLQYFAPVIELHSFFKEVSNKYSKVRIDEVYILQNFDEMFKSGRFEEKMVVQKCNKPIVASYFHYDNITSNNIKCISFHGRTSQLIPLLQESQAKTVWIGRAEIALHDSFGNNIYWQARRSMRFNVDLRKIANHFRNTFLNSYDDKDNVGLPIDWRDEKLQRNAIGGPYLSIHLRRGDFTKSKSKTIPTIPQAADQIKVLMKKLNLLKIFVATDATNYEYKALQDLLSEYEVIKFIPTLQHKQHYLDGSIAIIEQIICSYSRFFLGTHESTFSFRIQEEREILGFQSNTTFNAFCGDKCIKPSVWTITY